MEISFAFAFTAGLVATLNPCGFAMLPAYLSYFMGLDDGPRAGAALRSLRALRIGGVVAAGFLVVFGLAGILITLGVRAVVDAMPWIAMAVGIGVIGLGAAMLAGRELRVSLPRTTRAPTGRNMRGVFWFGVSYAIASLSCTLPVFLVVVAGTIPQLGVLAGVLTFLVYGAGMAVLLLLVTIALAFGKQALIARLRQGSAAVNRIAGGILIAAGGYIVYFWATTLRSTDLTQPALVQRVEGFSSQAVNTVASVATPIAIAAGVVLATTLIASWVALRRGRHDDRDQSGAAGARDRPAAECDRPACIRL